MPKAHELGGPTYADQTVDPGVEVGQPVEPEPYAETPDADGDTEQPETKPVRKAAAKTAAKKTDS